MDDVNNNYSEMDPIDSLHWACYYGLIDIIKELFKTSCKSSDALNELIRSENYLSFFWACHRGHFDVVVLMIEIVSKYNPESLTTMIKSGSGNSISLNWAIENRYFDIALLTSNYS